MGQRQLPSAWQSPDNSEGDRMDLDIGRVILELPGLSESEARHLAWLVGEALGAMDAPGAAIVAHRLRFGPFTRAIHPRLWRL